ncbi:hypothetical protein C8A05DRAFT_37910, partial [Staphylotrichum tortipilum]
MRLPTTTTLLLSLLAPLPALAVFPDEVNHIDYHHLLLGLPSSQQATFFHRPRRADPASLLYTLTDVGVVGAVNPATGGVVWRQDLRGDNNKKDGERGLVVEGKGWVVSAWGNRVEGWDA